MASLLPASCQRDWNGRLLGLTQLAALQVEVLGYGFTHTYQRRGLDSQRLENAVELLRRRRLL